MASHYQLRVKTRGLIDPKKIKPKYNPQEIIKGLKTETLKEILEALCLLYKVSHRKSDEFVKLYNKFQNRCHTKLTKKEVKEAEDFLKPRVMFHCLGPLTSEVRNKIKSIF